MIVYEVFVRSFKDGNGDGIGDLKGIMDSVEYFEYLGVDTLWLTPIFFSPSFHGYDVAEYYSVNPLYGNINDFENLVDTLHAHGMRLIIDLPLNHTSFLHRWFSEKPDYYVWADVNTDINETRSWDNIPVWHSSERGYYRGTFGRCFPDLNYENPEVVAQALDIVRFWKEKGVDGFRFDAAKHIYNDHEKNLKFWKKIVELTKENLNVAEVWDVPAVMERYADVVGYSFNFTVFGALRKSVFEKNPLPLYEALLLVKNSMSKYFNFLSNHDVTRLASDVPGERERLFAFGILFTLPGIPVLFYGDELGMPGVYDPYSPEDVVEPFPWTEDMCSGGNTRWKSSKFAKPYRGYSVHYQKHHGGFLTKIKAWLDFRRKQSWIDNADLTEIYQNRDKLVYTISKEEKSVKVSLDFRTFSITLS